MEKTFKFTLRSPEKAFVLDEQVQSVYVTTTTGPMMLYAHHASITGCIHFSKIKIRHKDVEDQYMVRNGTVYFDNKLNHAYMLVLNCELMGHVSTEGISAYLKHIEELLAKGESLNDIQIKFLKNEKIAMQEEIKAVGSK